MANARTIPLTLDGDRLLKTFLAMVAIDSPTGHEAELGDWLEARLVEAGCATRRDEIGTLVAVCPGTREGTILAATHMDTAGTDRRIGPIIGDDGIIRADWSTILGADDKSGLSGCLELLALSHANPGTSHPTIEFVVSVGEVSGLAGSRQMDVSRLSATHGFVLDTAARTLVAIVTLPPQPGEPTH